MAFNVLIVEDEPITRKLIIRALRQSGLQLSGVFEAANGVEGLKMLAEQNIDFAVIDLYMPVMNGEEMVARMKEDPQFNRLPFVFISAETQPQRIEELKSKNFGFIQKPFTVT